MMTSTSKEGWEMEREIKKNTKSKKDWTFWLAFFSLTIDTKRLDDTFFRVKIVVFSSSSPLFFILVYFWWDSKFVCLFVCLLILQPSMMFAILKALEQSVMVLIKQSSLGRTTPAITFITAGPHCGAIPLNVMACFGDRKKDLSACFLPIKAIV